DTAVTISVLLNDTDPDEEPLMVTGLTQPTLGTVVLNANGALTYTPPAGFTGTTTFTYKADDGLSDSNVATVTVQVTAPTNTTPTAVNDSATTNKGTAVTISVLANDTDTNGDALTVTSLT